LKWVGGRFNYGADIDSARFPPFPALYLAEDVETGLREMHGLVRESQRAGLSAKELSLCSESGVTWAAVAGRVYNVFDLTRPSNLRAFVTVLSTFKVSRDVRAQEDKLHATPLRLIKTAEELQKTFIAENWRELPAQFSTPANSQLFGHLLSIAGFDGVLFSSTITGKHNLAVFPRQLENSASLIQVLEPPPGAKCSVLSAANYVDAERVDWP
jgi:RES domain-containing protein